MSEKLLHQIIDTLKVVQGDVSSLKESQDLMKDDTSGMKSDISGIKVEMTGIKDDIFSLKETTARMEKKLNITNEQTGKLTEQNHTILARLDNMATKENLEFFDMKIGKHDRDIYKEKVPVPRHFKVITC